MRSNIWHFQSHHPVPKFIRCLITDLSSEWFRQSARTAAVKPRFSKEEAGYLRTLSGMANNLNQLTKLAHTGRLVTIMVDLRKLLKQVEQLMERIGKGDS